MADPKLKYERLYEIGQKNQVSSAKVEQILQDAGFPFDPPQRYALMDQPAEMDPDSRGEWVRWADVKHLFKE